MPVYTTQELVEMNAQLEREMSEQGAARYLHQTLATRQGSKGGKVAMESQTSYGHSLLKDLIPNMAHGLRNFLALSRGKAGKTPEAVYKLTAMSPEVTCYIAAKTIIDSLSTGEKHTILVMKIATKITDEIYLDQLRVHNKDWYEKLEKSLNKAGTTDYTHKMNVFRNMGAKAGIPKGRDGWDCMAKMGQILVHIFKLHTGLVDLHTEWEFVNGKRVSTTWVYPTPKASAFIENNMLKMQDLTPDCGPLCIKPKQWSNPFNGGYHTPELRALNPMVHTRSKEQIKELIKRGNFDYDQLNILNNSAWRVNKEVLDVLKVLAKDNNCACLPGVEAFKGFACPIALPARVKDRAQSKRNFKNYMQSLTQEEQDAHNDWKELSRTAYRNDRKRFSRRKQLGTVIRQATRYSHFEEIFIPHFKDSRGRGYATGSWTPQSVDFSKATYEPAHEVALGVDGYKWMCIQLTGVYGYDKETIKDRLQWVTDNHDMLIQVASDPLNAGLHLWSNKKLVDKPWQFLAACLQYRHTYQQHLMGIPYEACTNRLVAAQDGSCNGIQHFSAMLKDEVGGAQVNLTSNKTDSVGYPVYVTPADIYRAVAIVTTGKMQVVKADDFALASILMAMTIDRGTCKKPTMIVPYGGTIQGCKEYSVEWVQELYDMNKGDQAFAGTVARVKSLDTKLSKALSMLGNYLGTKIWSALDEVVVGAVHAMRFIKRIVRAVSAGSKDSENGQVVAWPTADGFYVVQDYRDTTALDVSSRLCGRLQMRLQVPNDKIKESKMRTSSSPNFVHGTDASHLFNTLGVANREHGIDFFACIHDSIGTHCGNSETLAGCIRTAFVDIHMIYQPLRRLYRELLRQWTKIDNPKIEEFPKWEEIEKHMGKLNLTDVLDSPFFFI